MMKLACWHKRVKERVVLDTGFIWGRENLMEGQFAGESTGLTLSICSQNYEERDLTGHSYAGMRILKITFTKME